MNISVEMPVDFEPFSVENLRFNSLDQFNVPIENPYFEEIKEELVDFAKKHEILLPNYEEYYNMVSFLYPEASREKLLLIGKIMMILFYIDDTLGEEGQGKLFGLDPYDLVNSLLLKLKKNTLVGTNPIENAVFVVWEELASSSNPKFIERFFRSVNAYLPQNVDLSDEHAANEDNYIHYRIDNSGMNPTIILAELAMGVFLSELFLDSDVNFSWIEELTKVTAIIGAITNDIMSFPKEVLDHNAKLNYIAVLMRQGFSLQDATEVAIDFVNRHIDFFVSMVRKLPLQFEDENKRAIVEKYCIAMVYIVKATKNWQLYKTNRYKHLLHIVRELKLS